MEIVGQVEIDDYCQKVLALRWPHVPKRFPQRRGVGDFGTNLQDTRRVSGHVTPRCAEQAGKAPANSKSQPRSIFNRNSPAPSNYWSVEPDVGRVVARYSIGSHTGGVDAHEICIQKASAKGVPQTDRLRTLREYQKSSKTSSQGTGKCSFCGHPVSGVPCEGPCSPWYLGKRQSEAEDLRCLREGVFSLLPQSDQDLRTRVLGNTRTLECEQTVASRADRLKLLGNGQVVQVVEWIGKKIIEFENAGK